jgi:hypothetical protein
MQAISLVKIGLFPSYICFINKVHADNPKLHVILYEKCVYKYQDNHVIYTFIIFFLNKNLIIQLTLICILYKKKSGSNSFPLTIELLKQNI